MKSYYFSHSHPGLNRINVVATTPETMEDVQSRLQTAAPDDVFSAQSEAFAMWIALTHPHYGDMYFVFVNSTSTVPGTSPPDLPATLNNTFQISSISKTFLGTAMLLLEEMTLSVRLYRTSLLRPPNMPIILSRIYYGWKPMFMISSMTEMAS